MIANENGPVELPNELISPDLMRNAYDRVWNKGDLEEVSQLYPDMISHIHMPKIFHLLPVMNDPKGLVSCFHAAFPDMHLTIEDQIGWSVTCW